MFITGEPELYNSSQLDYKDWVQPSLKDCLIISLLHASCLALVCFNCSLANLQETSKNRLLDEQIILVSLGQFLSYFIFFFSNFCFTP